MFIGKITHTQHNSLSAPPSPRNPPPRPKNTPYVCRIPISCPDAVSLNNRHRAFPDAAKDRRNLAVRTASCVLTGRKLKLRWHSPTTIGEPVRNIFINKRVMLNSNDCLSRESIGQASVAYNRIGKHLNRSRATTVSSEAALPILLNMALKAR